MKPARERAIDAIYQAMGKGYSRLMFEHLVADAGEIGCNLKKLVDAVEQHIELDRKALTSLRAPS